jgi:hypothetical protein
MTGKFRPVFRRFLCSLIAYLSSSAIHPDCRAASDITDSQRTGLPNGCLDLRPKQFSATEFPGIDPHRLLEVFQSPAQPPDAAIICGTVRHKDRGIDHFLF